MRYNGLALSFGATSERAKKTINEAMLLYANGKRVGALIVIFKALTEAKADFDQDSILLAEKLFRTIHNAFTEEDEGSLSRMMKR